MADHITRIGLWSGPRNISTALMYSFAQRTDTRVYDEPLYGYYLKHSAADEYHPAAQQTMASQELDGQKVVEYMLSDESKPVLFFKNMTHHLLDLDISFMKSMVNVMLTRSPRDMIMSFAKVIPNPTMTDIGYAAHIELVNRLKEMGITPIILDSKEVLLNPEQRLKQLCKETGIPWNREMLQWKSGARPEDGVWAPHWYSNVHKSTGFGPYKENPDPFPQHLNDLLKESQELYEELIAIA